MLILSVANNCKMKKYIAVLLILAISCTKEVSDYEYVCNCKQQEKASLFVQTSIKASNNMSDEEMEDVIAELTKTSVRLNCSKKQIKYNYNQNSGQREVLSKLDSCEVVYFEY